MPSTNVQPGLDDIYLVMLLVLPKRKRETAMSLRSTILNAVIKDSMMITDCASKEDIMKVISLLTPVPIGVELIRIGSEGDGGYLIPDDMDGIEYCFSPGVSEVADFEGDLASRFGIKSFLADASVEAPPSPNGMFDFEKKFLGATDGGDFIRLSTWINEKLGPGERSDMILQMDIEGAEFDVLIETSIETLRRFRVMVIEFHELDMLLTKKACRFLTPIFEKLAAEFVVAHIHPNNYRAPSSAYGIKVPRILEVTFLRKDRIKEDRAVECLSFPHKLDRKNVPSAPDVILPEMWWKPQA
ncbi:methyltransferase FkbM domain protein [Rhizobium sp. CF080]|uniref:FkbM family methyltransferase n=1 Tax=Rhizobium sp. (strain CF080) TaxID=1144310 RepID=UPI000271BDC7|nr:FkbM family methyltransferase [Rhizobium sp. CF080]EUB97311.1 methyltransferase FkbM domain protein [Rhizobium sp. CF080]